MDLAVAKFFYFVSLFADPPQDSKRNEEDRWDGINVFTNY